MKDEIFGVAIAFVLVFGILICAVVSLSGQVRENQRDILALKKFLEVQSHNQLELSTSVNRLVEFLIEERRNPK